METYYCKTCDKLLHTCNEGRKCPFCKEQLRFMMPAGKRPPTLEESIEDKVGQIDKLLRSVIIDAADLGYAPLVQSLSDSFLRLYDAKQDMFWKQREIGSAYIGVEPE